MCKSIDVYVLINYKFQSFAFFQITSHIISQSNETAIITHEVDQLSIQFILQCLPYVLCDTIALTLVCMPQIT